MYLYLYLYFMVGGSVAAYVPVREIHTLHDDSGREEKRRVDSKVGG